MKKNQSLHDHIAETPVELLEENNGYNPEEGGEVIDYDGDCLIVVVDGEERYYCAVHNKTLADFIRLYPRRVSIFYDHKFFIEE